MKIVLKILKEFDAKYLKVSANVRYWEDTTVDGVEDSNGDLIPCRENDCWCPIIEIETGKILNWKDGVIASIHYKVCDEGTYELLDSKEKEIKQIEGYVPEIMCPEKEGYGDYIKMEISSDGTIQNWEPNLSEWEDIED